MYKQLSLGALVVVCLLASCASQPTAKADHNTPSAPATPPDAAASPKLNAAPQSSVLTAEQQAALKPEEVLQLLSEGNSRFVKGELTVRDYSRQIREAASGQYPKAAVLSCLDSRVPVEDVFDRGIGDVFVARVAGNFENADIVASMEFATKVSGAKLILVLGHEECGAIKGAIDDVRLGTLGPMLDNIRPAILATSDYAGNKTSKNKEYVNLVAEKNIELTIRDIMERSEVIRQLVAEGKLKVVGGMYDLDTGIVTMMIPSSPLVLKAN